MSTQKTIITNEVLKKNFDIAMKIVKDVIGEERVKEVGLPIIRVDVSPRAVSRHGICKRRSGSCIIEVSQHLFDNDDEMINTLIHEILHTFSDCKGHGARWLWYAKKITDNTKYTITVCSAKGSNERFRYEITCNGCGNVYHRCKMSERQKTSFINGRYACGECESHKFKIIDKKTGVVIC